MEWSDDLRFTLAFALGCVAVQSVGFHANAVHQELHQISPAVLNPKTLTVAGWTGKCRLVSLAKVAALANVSEDEAVFAVQTSGHIDRIRSHQQVEFSALRLLYRGYSE